MKCDCGISYSDHGDQWRSLYVTQGIHDKPGYLVFAGFCPECDHIGIKLSSVRPGLSHIEALKQYGAWEATPIFPPETEWAREPIDTQGVPDYLRSTYRKALLATADSELYGYASILARRAIESALKEQGFTGRDLSQLIDKFQQTPTGVPRGILDHIDAIRNLGNWDAHETADKKGGWLEPSRTQCAWAVTLLERFLDHFYVQPAIDKAHFAEVNDASTSAGKPPLRQPP